MSTLKPPGWDCITEDGMAAIRKCNIHGSTFVCYTTDCSVGIMSAICLINTVLSSAPDESVVPSGENATCLTGSLCSVNVPMHDPSLVLHNRTVVSQDADAMYDPHGEKHAVLTSSECPSSDEIMTPVDAFQIFTVLSHDADSKLPSGENETSSTQSVCCVMTKSDSPVSTSQIRTVLSKDTVTMRVLVGLNAAAVSRSV